jgi:hypothetical protein
MSETGEAKAKKDALASGAKPSPEGRVRERGWRPTRQGRGIPLAPAKAARRLAIAHAADTPTDKIWVRSTEAA